MAEYLGAVRCRFKLRGPGRRQAAARNRIERPSWGRDQSFARAAASAA